MNVYARLLFVALLCLGSAYAAEPESRFSHSLSAPELGETGIARLNSDHVAVLDALVRRDLTARLDGRREEAPNAFSQRLTADERGIAGLAELTPAELSRADALIERFQSIVVARVLLSPPVFVSRHANLRPSETKAERKLHGTFSMSLGWGSGGYSERTGSMEVHTELAPGLHVGVGYSQTRVKGDGVYYYRNDPYYNRSPVVVGPPTP